MSSYRIEETVLPTPERIAKGGIELHYGERGEYKSCTPEGTTVLDWLGEREIIGPREWHAAQRYLFCQAVFYQRTGYQLSPWCEASGDPGTGHGDSPKAMADEYSRVIRTVAKAHCKTVEMAASTTFETWLRQPLFDLRHKFQEAFEALADAFEGKDNAPMCQAP